ncbi:MAG: DEAD/DEAH box helicase [Bacteroidetes bacterium HGW-Bacteroidetes-11]|nr:MAG: DEAD/DEAH box helicase [Bacteroidetes bacterium HGW-Bacteroidetes-11]
MQAFEIHRQIIDDYKEYLSSFNIIRDERIKTVVDKAFREQHYIPDPLIQFNPSFKRAADFKALIQEGVIHPKIEKTFGDFHLFVHQEKALRLGTSGNSFVVTSGTGSGKSLTFLGTIFDFIFRNPGKKGLKAVLVYPMNALINSQEEEIDKFAKRFGNDFPITYNKYTGQESEEKRREIEANPPDIILTNYMMLELILTRAREQYMRDSFADNLRFLVFDELHTYRGRQGADVALLIRRLKSICKNKIQCIGTSATMISGEDVDDSKQVVADFASLIFSETVEPAQIVEEALENSTIFNGKLPTAFDLQEAIHQPMIPDGSKELFVKNHLAIWLENSIALFKDKTDRLRRAKPMTLKAIVERLSEDAGEPDSDKCKNAMIRLFAWAETLNIRHLSEKKSFLPFKIHQFVSQTGNVYVTLDTRENRKITLEDGLYLKEGSSEEKTIFPVLFSRYTGFDFICVRKNRGEHVFEPRDPAEIPEKFTKDELKGDKEAGIPKRKLSESDFESGYLLIEDDEVLWDESQVELLPETWWKVKNGKAIPENFYEFRLPSKVYFNQQGKYSDKPEPGLTLKAWFIAAPLLIDPTSGIVFDERTKENTKLMRVGNVGKSTATTITAFSILKGQHLQKVNKQSQKVLSFTDNRQDASLQAGHFNDFMMIGRMRSAIYHALKEAEGQQLKIENIAEVVFKKLGLKEVDYARNPGDPDWPEPENEKAIRDFLKIRILHDLRRGWRFNTPNLEQCALLEIKYDQLSEFAAKDSMYEHDVLFSKLSHDDRYNVLRNILNYFRTSYAFDYYMLEDDKVKILEERLKQRLDIKKEWSLDADETLTAPSAMVYQSPGKTNKRTFTESIGPMSSLGKYLKRQFSQNGLEVLKGQALSGYIAELCLILKKKYLTETEVKGENGTVKGYRLRVEHVIWKLGDGKKVITDEVRIHSTKGNLKIFPNDYFKRFYQQDFKNFDKSFVASEHTGQIGTIERIEREKYFREGRISALFCSPTMELGIDISNLNIVHMRNVPPNPANYTQRSGRAGRSGQTAVVFTYCSYASPHDRHYFKNSIKMVAGEVKAPRIDLINEELIVTHLNAYILTHLKLTEISKSAEDFIHISDKVNLPIKQELTDYILDQQKNYAQEWADGFSIVIEKIIPELKSAGWFNDEWLKARCNEFYHKLDQSFERWRRLFRAASAMIESGTITMNDPTIAASSYEANEAKRKIAIGARQRDLLLNNISRFDGTNESEFYIYRYLASEGFLPGYNFTRLPVRAFVGRRNQNEGTYISRPRFIALREFGPGNLIYHNGGKFRITRMQFTEADMKPQSLKISLKTGFAWLNENGTAINNDPITGEALKGLDTTRLYNKRLLELVESDTQPVERISSEEEDRTSTGYEIEQYFNYPKGIEGTLQTTLSASGQPLLNIIFCKATQLIQVNKKWRRSKGEEEGFNIGKSSGKWLKKSELAAVDREKDPSLTIHLFTTDTADSLYIQPVESLALSEDGVISLTFALKRAIERVFQIEESEVNVWFMGPEESRNILIYEAAQGSLGILSQLIAETSKLREVFREAYRVIQYDPDTHQDTAPDKPRASYDDLLSYYNQRYHEKLDRHSIKGALELLMICESDNTAALSSHFDKRETHYQFLLGHYDQNSVMEKKLIDFLYINRLRLPDRAQVNLSKIAGFYISADFIYMDGNDIEAIVFCDGSVHDKNEVHEDDHHKRKLLSDAGYDVIEWHYAEPLEKLVERRKDIFRKI